MISLRKELIGMPVAQGRSVFDLHHAASIPE